MYQLFGKKHLAFVYLVFSFISFSLSASVVDAVVNIEFSKVRAWDDSYNSSGVGTGFVIDAKRGLILTNRHILNVAPVVAYAEFSNKQLLPLTPVYRDPIHDFGVFSYDPAALDTLEITAIELVAEATIGEPITLYGNDGGEALSIIEGVLSRTERPAPKYGSTNTDVNTFYYQAALGSSGGSSGSPILNSKNQAIALNAGGRRDTAASFFVPMKMILPTIQKLFDGQEITRGTLETVFEFEPYNVMRKIGWDDDKISQARQQQPSSKGKLIVAHVVPQSSADLALNVGDILLSVDEHIVSDYYQLAEILNGKVGKSVTLLVERQGQQVTTSLHVSNLFDLVPDKFVEYGSTIIIEVGINLSRLYNIPMGGVVVVDPGLLLGSQNIRRLAMIDELDGNQINSLEDLQVALSTVSYGDKFSVKYRYPYDNANQQYKLLTDFSQWFSNRRCDSKLNQILWECSQLAKTEQVKPKVPKAKKQAITSPIVNIEVFRPIAVNLNNDVIRRGLGVVVDAEKGLIITDKTLIDSTLAEVSVMFNNGANGSAKVLAIHPYLNMVLIQTNPSGLSFKRNTVPKLKAIESDVKSKLTFISNSSFKDYRANAELGWPTVGGGSLAIDTYAFSVQPDNFGIYVDKNHHLIAINPAYSDSPENDSGIPIELIYPFVTSVVENNDSLFKAQDTFSYVSYGKAIELGLPASYQSRVGRFIAVNSTAELANSGFRAGDLVLKIGDEQIISLNQFYTALRKEESNVTVLRGGEAIDIKLMNKEIPFVELQEVLFWGGAVIHEISANLKTPEGLRDKCIRIGVRYFGAPVHSSGLSGATCIYSIDGTKVETLGQLKSIVFNKSFGDYTIVQTIDLDKNFQILEHKITEETYYWPSLFYFADKGASKGWRIETQENAEL